MLTSAELRWFMRGALPQEIAQWFQQYEDVTPPEEREDLYLYVPENDYMGIKLRQGRLEIKWRKAELGILRFGDTVEGNAEKWGKWLCEDPTQESFQLQDDVSTWVNVKKVRSQRLYETCAVELTELSVNGNDWWSLALEAVGDSSLLDMQTVASKVFQNYRALKLTAKDSYAYPRWLSLVV